MILRAYSIFDRKSLQYYPPYWASTDGAAARTLADAAADPNSSIGRHPMDYVLFHVGEYDDQKGTLTPCSPLNHVIDAIALVPVQQQTFDYQAGLPNGRDNSNHLIKEA